jgi:7,8-dihydroneopterin aldolase/epimerase/oxygenase
MRAPMTDEIALAFAHPAARAAARPGLSPDRISLRDHIRAVDIGAFQVERGLSQRLRFNLVVEVGSVSGDIADDVDRILSYDHLTDAITMALAAERLNLLETLAERVADRVLAAPKAARVFVRIEKLDRGPGALGVEIVRGQGVGSLGGAASDLPLPRIILLSNATIRASDLSQQIDRLLSEHQPLILCVGPSDTPAPQVGNALAQRRIDLLAIEQNAWALAARDRRCIVVGTRTELDWAMKQGQISVWAPSKMVLDAVEHPPGDVAGMVVWFAAQMGGVFVPDLPG